MGNKNYELPPSHNELKNKKLRILILEDVITDAEFMERELRRAGIKFSTKRVDTEEAFLKEVNDFTPDIILADYSLPTFDGLSALEIAKKKCPDVPFVIVSGAIGEELAIEILKKGATDYVLKDRVSRLVPIINRALREADERAERKHVEKALGESRQNLEAVVETVPSLIVLSDPDGRIILFNRACEELTGYDRKEVLGKTISELFLPPEWIPVVKKRFADPYAPGVSTPHENPWITKTGEVRLIEWHCTVIPSPKNGKPCILGTGIDITEHKRALEALRESEEKYRAVFENTGAATGIIEEDMIISLVNKEFENLSGYSKEEIEDKKSWTEFVVKDDLERMKKYHYLRRTNTNLVPRKYEFRFNDKQGNIKEIFLTVDMIPGTKKSIASLLDVSESKRAEEALRNSQKELKERVKELEEFYNMAIGRELKMIELKNEIEELKAELSKYNKDKLV